MVVDQRQVLSPRSPTGQCLADLERVGCDRCALRTMRVLRENRMRSGLCGYAVYSKPLIPIWLQGTWMPRRLNLLLHFFRYLFQTIRADNCAKNPLH